MSKSSYVPALTWLRGLAAFVVVVSHAIRTVEGPWSVSTEGLPAFFTQKLWFARLFDLGSFGVCLFFALSGFTLYLSNRSALQRWADVPAFYLKRVARIWPAFMVSLLVYTVFAKVLWPYYWVEPEGWMQGNFRLPETAGGVMNYVLLMFDISGPAGYFVGPYWSLPIEFHYYLLMAPVVILMARCGSWRWLCPVAAGSALLYAGMTLPVPIADTSLLTMSLSFFLGVALADLHQRQWLPVLKNQFAVWGLVLAAFGMVTGIWQGLLPWEWMTPAFTGCAIVMIYAFLNIRQKTESGPLTRLLGRYGTYSYSIYLYHMLSFGAIALGASLLEIQLDESLFWPVFLLGVTSSYGLAYLSYRWVEVPSIDFGRRLAQRVAR
ncbi:peptidoglycan/LPS O-acetylase OafA/YrhL [Fluviicoccus keumensis]|uniref:Peptidoglycan/LPS O-acetylase OafA/YrhL n=1 Tax=Fluviicoccus keumensis TaxID=1435465 RepID=A0A4Q7ZA20_9GAMM|nr:acyltransferase [Fluviicoccus keumensis]RZU47407.1 peptidoglycan/LPS O-acetylase OafA/YrhL [Fluviicoccus keumensis]